MANEEHVELVRKGPATIYEWRKRNRLVRLNLQNGDFSDVDLSQADLSGADLSEANLSRSDLRSANLERANLQSANLRGADLREAELSRANLNHANLDRADLGGAHLIEANLCEANLSKSNLRVASLSQANLHTANLSLANLTGASLAGADLYNANLQQANLNEVNLSTANFSSVLLRGTVLGDLDLSNVLGLSQVRHSGPSTVGLDTLYQSKGKIPEEFLRGCGVPHWLIEVSRLCVPELSAHEISEIVSTTLFGARTDGTAFLGGVFISYSHANSKFVDKLYTKLNAGGASAWLDRHDLVAGPIEKQLIKAIRIQDSAVLVLSKDSIQSDWCWHEIQEARRKEKVEARDVLCPISLDDAWRKPDEFGDQVKYMVESHQVEMDFLRQKNILDFSKPRMFDEQLQKLVKGLKIYYAPK